MICTGVSKWQFVLSIDFIVMYKDLVLGLFLRGMLDLSLQTSCGSAGR